MVGIGMPVNNDIRVEPNIKQRKAGSEPDFWKVKDGSTTVSEHNTKSAAQKAGKRLAKKENRTLRIFNAMKSNPKVVDYSGDEPSANFMTGGDRTIDDII